MDRENRREEDNKSSFLMTKETCADAIGVTEKVYFALVWTAGG